MPTGEETTPASPPPTPPAPSAPPPPRRRRWLRRLAWALGALVLLVFLAPFAAGLAPVRHWIARKASAELGRPVTIGGLSASWWGGVEVRNLEVHNPEGFVGEPLLFVERARVRVAVVPLLGGRLDASAVVTHPVVTVIETADGRRNTDGLGERGDGPRKERPKSSPRASDDRGARRDRPDADVTVTVEDGRLVVYGPPGGARASPEVVDAIALDLRMRRGGSVKVAFHATATEAAPGGGPAEVDVQADLDDDGSGAVKVDFPTVDLGRVRSLLAPALGLDDLAGTFSARADVDLDPNGNPSGTARVVLAGVRATKGSGTIDVRSVVLDANPEVVAGRSRFPLELTIEGLAARGFTERDAGFEEPRLRVAGTLFRAGRGDVAFGEPAAPIRIEGRAISGTVSGGLTGLDGEHASADVKAHLALSLSPSLGRLAGLLEAKDDDLRGEATLDASVAGTGGALEVRVDGTLRDLVVGGAGGSTPWTESKVTLEVAGAWDGTARSLTIGRGVLASNAVSVTAKDPLIVVVPREEGVVSVKGQATVAADFVRLARVRSIVPELKHIRSGSLAATVTFEHGLGTTVGFAVRIVDLGFTPGAWSSAGYVERDVSAQGRYEKPALADATLTLVSFKSGIASLADGRGPVKVRLGTDSFGVEGVAALAIDLAAARGAFDRALGLAPGDALAGHVLVTATGAGDARSSTFDVTAEGRDLRLPGGDPAAPGRLDARLKVRSDAAAKTWTVESADVSGYGLAIRGKATLATGADGTDLRTAHVEATGDLVAARPLLALTGALERDAVLEGDLDAKADVTAEGGGRAVVGKAVVRRLRWAANRRAKALEEAAVTLEHDVLVGAPAGSHRVRRLALSSAALTITATGSATERGDSLDVDGRVDVDGDAKVLAADARALLGEDYDDLTGEGRVKGRFAVSGPLADGGKALVVDGDLSFGKFVSGGLTLSDGKVSAKRAKAADPLVVSVASGVNGGRLTADASVDLARGEGPWKATIAARTIDTSALVTGKGASRFLPMVLPALVPAGSKTPVLSGRLDADVELASRSISDPLLTDALTGKGTLSMGKGTLTESTLFGAIAGKGKGGAGLVTLAKLVPELGRELEAFGKAVVFSEMTSRFGIGGRKVRLDEVKLTAERASLVFSGVVGFDGRTDLRVPLRLGGDVGRAIKPYVKDSTIPLRVRGDVESPKVEPDLKLENVGKGLLDDLLKGNR